MTNFIKPGLVFLCTVFHLFSYGQEKKNRTSVSIYTTTIKVGVYNEPPEIFIDADGNPKGVFIDLLEYIAKKQDLDIEYVRSEWPTLIDQLKTGEIDVLPNMSYTKERDSLFLLNELPILTSWLEIYSGKDARINSILDLNNKKVGVLKNSVVQEYLQKTVKKNSNLDIQPVMFPDYSGMVTAIQNKKIDAFFADRFFRYSKVPMDNVHSTGVAFHPICVHFAFARNEGNKPLVNIFDTEIADLRTTSGSAYFKSVNRWIGGYFGNYIPSYLDWIIVALFVFLLFALIYVLIGRNKIRIKNNSLRLSNETLVKAIDEARESNKMKTAFLQNVSHEIRTPMNGIIGFMNLLKEPNLEPETRNEFIELLNQSGKRLLNTVDEIVEISKIESGIEKINMTVTNVEEVLLYFIQFYSPQANEKSIALQLVEERDSVNAQLIQTDKKKLEGILTSLLNNAIKFTEKGSVEIGNYIEKERLVFYVKDTGVGIPADRTKVIFDRFVQADCSINRSHEGVGLGLTIAKGYVEALNGKIWVDSQEGKGSTFYFSIPYSKAIHQNGEIDVVRVNTSNETILLVEDDETNFLYCKYVLQREGFNVVHVIDGVRAVESIRNNSGISLVLMDIKMPVMDGFEATRKIRQFNETIPVIVQTAHSFVRDRERAFNAGCNDYITKPVSSEKLISTIKKHLAAVYISR